MVIDGVVIFNIVVGFVMLFLGNIIRSASHKAERESQTAQLLESRVQALEIKSVDDAKVRAIVTEMLADIKVGQAEIRADLKGLAGEIHELAQTMTANNLRDR